VIANDVAIPDRERDANAAALVITTRIANRAAALVITP
jgi:hypothetical protein